MSTKIEIGPYSAYAIAVKYGYTGTEEEWIAAVENDRIRAEKAAQRAEQLMSDPDKTLTQEGVPADAKAVGDALGNINLTWDAITGKPSSYRPFFDEAQYVALNDLDQDTWYPVVKWIPGGGLHHIKCNVQLSGTSRPTWSTHAAGFTANLDMLVTASGWGTTSARSICLDNSYQFTLENACPIGYQQLWKSSMAVFWLRGGGAYYLYSDWGVGGWRLVTDSYTNEGQTVSPGAYPGVNYNRATLDSDKYPVGSIYMSTSSTSPASLFGGSWESIASERVLMGVSGSHGAGSTVSAGLPNIVGAVLDTWHGGGPSGSGALSVATEGTGSVRKGDDGTFRWGNFYFNAASYNSIYGNSSTVQPAAYYVYMWRRTG